MADGFQGHPRKGEDPCADRAEDGNLGDVKFFDGIGEMRMDYGPGYRVYFQRQGDVLVLLLCGGEKSTQQTDIKRALEIAKGL